MKNNMKINRRDFIKSSVLAGGALLVQSGIPAAAAGMVAGNAVDDAPQDAGDGLLKGVCDIHLPCLWGEGMQMAQYKRQSAGEFAAFARINPSRSFITTDLGQAVMPHTVSAQRGHRLHLRIRLQQLSASPRHETCYGRLYGFHVTGAARRPCLVVCGLRRMPCQVSPAPRHTELVSACKRNHGQVTWPSGVQTFNRQNT